MLVVFVHNCLCLLLLFIITATATTTITLLLLLPPPLCNLMVVQEGGQLCCGSRKTLDEPNNWLSLQLKKPAHPRRVSFTAASDPPLVVSWSSN